MMNLLPLFCAVLLSPDAVLQGAAQDPPAAQDAALLPVALRKLDAMTDPAIVANRDTLRAVLERYYLHRETMKSSEFKLVDAFLEAASSGRGGAASGLAAMLRDSGAAPEPPKPKKTKTLAKSKPATKPARPRKKTIAFSAQTHRNPGGQSVGVVAMRRAGVATPLIEVYPGGGLGVGPRAQVIATRFERLQALDPLWWMKLKVGTYNGLVIVSSPRAEKGIVVTADRPFAQACGTDPEGLARMLIRKIRDGIEPSQSAARSFGDPEADLADAVAARQRGDALAERDSEGAAKAYREAIDAAPAYVVPYLRLAALRAEKGDKAAAKAVLNEGLAADGMNAEGKAQLDAALAKLG